jgi:hypothetical protein
MQVNRGDLQGPSEDVSFFISDVYRSVATTIYRVSRTPRRTFAAHPGRSGQILRTSAPLDRAGDIGKLHIVSF